MNTNIEKLNPQIVWKHFSGLCSIPRPSKHEAKVREYIIDFAKKHSLEYLVDKTGNLLIRKNATPGMENKKGVILQAHLDMVPQKNDDKTFNFETDPIVAYIDGDWVTANGTTLGADNGMGVAAAMAVLEDNTLTHGPIEVLLTIDEETGLTGAFGLEGGLLKGEILMNLDSETEGELYVGCSGGIDIVCKLPIVTETTPTSHKAYTVVLKGFKGGHSGVEIILQRGNAGKNLGRFLRSELEKLDIRIANIKAGDVRNAIPREGVATVTVAADKGAQFEKNAAAFEAILKNELSATEPDLSFTVSETKTPEKVMNADTVNRLASIICTCPNGVIRMSDSIKGLVETSCNLGVIKSSDKEVKFIALVRSSVDSAKNEVSENIRTIMTLAGASYKTEGGYHGWNPNLKSPVLKIMKNEYKRLYGKTPKIMAIHAGLECGIIGAKYNSLDMISFGPTIKAPHSPNEKVEIESVSKFYNFLTETLKNIPNK